MFVSWILQLPFRVQITTFNISLVVHGTIAENMDFAEVIKFYL